MMCMPAVSVDMLLFLWTLDNTTEMKTTLLVAVN